MSDNRNQTRVRPPTEYRGRNTDSEGNVISAEQERQRSPWEARLNGDELASMRYLEPGARLEQGQSYLDLNQVSGGPFTPTGSRSVEEGDRIVAQRDIDPELWRKLVGE